MLRVPTRPCCGLGCGVGLWRCSLARADGVAGVMDSDAAYALRPWLRCMALRKLEGLACCR